MMDRITLEVVQAKYAELAALSVPDRRTRTANYDRAAEWARAMVAAAAPAATVRLVEQGGYRNLEIAIKGSDPNAGLYIVGGHLDSVRATTAMDDNGSGSLGTALIGIALAHYRYAAEIRAVLFDAEEIGLFGSTAYARALLAGGCLPDSCLKAFINLDMIGYDPDNRRRLRVRTDLMAMQTLFGQVNTDYLLGLTLSYAGGECHSSDDCSFSRQGYHAVYPFEGTITPHIHTPQDTIDTLNLTTLTSILQNVAGVLATAAAIQGPS
jgi:leucyl aminopeptidase